MATSHSRGLVRGIVDGVAERKLNVLLFLVPLSWALRFAVPGSTWLFVVSALAIVPLAGLIGYATEELARRSGPTLGGFLNATFGNAAELIIGLAALGERHIALVQASITGSIIGNLLLVFGLSMFVGGLGRRSQRFDRTVAGKTIGANTLAVRRPADVLAAGSCSVLFVSASEGHRLAEVLDQLRGRPILTVSDADGFAEAGGMIGLFIEDSRVRFAINLGAAESAHLTISSRLLNLARIVRSSPKGRS